MDKKLREILQELIGNFESLEYPKVVKLDIDFAITAIKEWAKEQIGKDRYVPDRKLPEGSICRDWVVGYNKRGEEIRRRIDE